MPVGGAALVEHPQFLTLHVPHSAASIWQLTQIKKILKHPDVCLFNVCQGHLGGRWLKPTTLLALLVPDVAALYTEMEVVPVETLDVLEGTDTEGFVTRFAKEYPPEMNRLLARSLITSIKSHCASLVGDALSCEDNFMQQFLKLVINAEADVPMGPDFRRSLRLSSLL